MESENKKKPLKSILIKMKNKRFFVVWFSDNTVGFTTKTLQDWKKRVITTTSGIYTMESFLILSEAFDFIYNDVDFAKISNPIKGEIERKAPTAKVFSAFGRE